MHPCTMRTAVAVHLPQLFVRHERSKCLFTRSTSFLLPSLSCEKSRMSDTSYSAMPMMQERRALSVQCAPYRCALYLWGLPQLAISPKLSVAASCFCLDFSLKLNCTLLSSFTQLSNSKSQAKRTHTCGFCSSSYSLLACASSWSPPCPALLTQALARIELSARATRSWSRQAAFSNMQQKG
jgi:hypothetical protein